MGPQRWACLSGVALFTWYQISLDIVLSFAYTWCYSYVLSRFLCGCLLYMWHSPPARLVSWAVW
jgi:hypothetical protein